VDLKNKFSNKLYHKIGELTKMTKNDYILKAFESIGEVIAHKETEISVLKYEIEKLKEELGRVKKI